MVITMAASLLVVCLLAACSFEVHSFEGCVCWRRFCLRHVYVGGSLIRGIFMLEGHSLVSLEAMSLGAHLLMAKSYDIAQLYNNIL